MGRMPFLWLSQQRSELKGTLMSFNLCFCDNWLLLTLLDCKEVLQWSVVTTRNWRSRNKCRGWLSVQFHVRCGSFCWTILLTCARLAMMSPSGLYHFTIDICGRWFCHFYLGCCLATDDDLCHNISENDDNIHSFSLTSLMNVLPNFRKMMS